MKQRMYLGNKYISQVQNLVQEINLWHWRRGLVVSSPFATQETGAMGREIESRQGIGW
jgi:hypothetical protein